MHRYFFSAVLAIMMVSGLDAGMDDPRGPIIRSQVTHIFDAKISGPGLSSGQKASATKGSIEALGGFPVYDKTAVLLGLGYETFHFDWGNNPHVVDETTHLLSLTVGAFSKDIADWRLMALVRLTSNLERGTFGNATTYRELVWGKYYWKEDVDLHVGLIASHGIEDWSVIPILGLDWRPSDDWEVGLVFPLNIGVTYKISEFWSASLKARAIRERHRLSAAEATSSGITEYEMYGGEFMLNYHLEKASTDLAAIVGYTGKQEFKVWNKFGKMKTTYSIDNVFYVGIRGDIEFPVAR